MIRTRFTRGAWCPAKLGAPPCSMVQPRTESNEERLDSPRPMTWPIREKDCLVLRQVVADRRAA